MRKPTLKKKLEQYKAWLRKKVLIVEDAGFEPLSPVNPVLKEHQKIAVEWAIKKGRAALFMNFGTGKSLCQLQLMKWIHEYTGKKALIVCPLGVKREFVRDGRDLMGMTVQYCRNDEEVAAADTPYIITNYERVREQNITVSQFGGVSLDEAHPLRSLGSLTTQTFLDIFKGVQYRFVATATPSPNEYKELIHYAEFLSIADISNLLTRFFGRNSKEAGDLKLFSHQEAKFWLWLASWALFVFRPSDVEGDDTGYDLPPFKVHWHEVSIDVDSYQEADDRGQFKLAVGGSSGVSQDARNRRNTVELRVDEAVGIVNAEPDKHWLIWHELDAELNLLQKKLPSAKFLHGSQGLEEREELVIGFSDGEVEQLATKPSLSGSGCNFQRYCSDAVFCGPTDKFADFIQAVHRIYRFQQQNQVNIHIVWASTQRKQLETMRRKWRQHDELVERMRSIVQEYGLSHEALHMNLERQLEVNRNVVTGKNFTLINGDCVPEMMQMKDDSVDQIVTSIPFSKAKTGFYEYSPHYADFGCNDGAGPFFQQMDFAIPEMLRILKPGRVACIHVKDSVEYGNVTGLGMYSVYEFSDDVVKAFKKHGFVYMGRIVIDTDVVRENAQTYRLGWSENAKDSTKMGCGSNEYVLLFRKWEPSMSPNDTANGPHPVTKDKEEYSRSRWQIHASGIWRDSGDRLIDPEFLKGMTLNQIYSWWRREAPKKIYDYGEHVTLCEVLEKDNNRLPSSWMLFSACSSNPDIWTDILRIDTLNTDLSRKVEQGHTCPLQLGVIRRLIERYSNPDDLIYDPFMGVGSTAVEALKMNRKVIGTELCAEYWRFSVGYCEQIEEAAEVPTLFDVSQYITA